MVRLACVDLPALPLQVLLTEHPEWREYPAAVVDRDSPQGVLQWVNARAREERILPGLRYATALQLSRDLRVGVVTPQDIEAAVERVLGVLWQYSPRIERCAKSEFAKTPKGRGSSRSDDPVLDDPGVFWLDVEGLLPLFASYRSWGSQVRAALAEASLVGGVAVGFSRFGSYAAAARGGVRVFETPSEEAEATLAVSLRQLDLAPRLREVLEKLGVTTVGRFVALPPDGLRKRFGESAYRLHTFARESVRCGFRPRSSPGSEANDSQANDSEARSSESVGAGSTGVGSTAVGPERMHDEQKSSPIDPAPSVPLEAEPFRSPLERRVLLDHPETDLDRILAQVELLLEGLLDDLERRALALASLELRFRLDEGEERSERLEPAAPTNEAARLLRLARLRFERLALESGVVEIELVAEGRPTVTQQGELFARREVRDLHAARRALAEVAAEFGARAVSFARLRDAHLPEGRFAWQPFGSDGEAELSAPFASVRDTTVDDTMAGDTTAPPRARRGDRPLVRRIYSPPRLLPGRTRHEPDGWLVASLSDGPVDEVIGPHVISGGWWIREVSRSYYYLRTRSGRWLWVFYEPKERRWYLQGEVE